ncbi:nonribosomal peptide synthetase anabaenopeptin synthetase AptA2 [Spongiactinospora gelatinilytica]|uniref:Nonribosomal peptide synthetase anabaenopeptin synthetase AptA2 n=1 Tax=Spongiactinospora gelatinilytica TaxID=2666298 RepID=A0A2W2I3U3_9ACTN|nr:amino acid adenylation domain-containing protein [Spongiactinospora gelatinilytica]PZG52807.1 nonribosomal peptide synthetase anabaenopeptin synthetase AptA2 [Spongiactinospora gelatinilytica]
MSDSTSTYARRAYRRARHGIHNLAHAEVIADPSGYIDAIRELGPLFFDEVGQVWVCSGYDAATEILSDPRRFSSARFHSPDDLQRRNLGAVAGVVDMLSRQMLFLDPPDHIGPRAAIRDHFLPARVRRSDAALRDIVASVLTTLPGGGAIDLISDFAGRLPTALVAGLLGVTDRPERIGRWADAYERLLGSLSTLPGIKDEEVIATLDEAMAAFQNEAAARLSSPGTDLISSMTAGLRDRPPANVQDRDNALRTVAANCVVLAAGGYQTLTHLISSTLLLLERHPGQRRLLQDDPARIDSVINEVMRLTGSSQYVARRANTDHEIQGVGIRAGETVLVLLAAANLDPARFTDPKAMRIDRAEGRHLGFGFGRHHCVGAPYAERMARWAVLDFLARYPGYRFDTGPSALEWGRHANTRCLAHARVLLDGTPARDEREQPWSAEWNDTAVPLGPERCWHQVFERHAAVRPDAVAVIDRGTAHTYRDLDQRANALARLLRGRGVEPGRVAGVTMSRSVDFIIAVIAIGKAGGAFMVADPTCPPERLRAMIIEASARLLLTDERTRTGISALSLPAEILEAGTEARAATPPVTGVHSGDTAYVAFTSGTSGRPRAVAVNHEALVNLHVAQRRTLRLGAGDRVLQFFSPNFDGWVFDLASSLLSGAALLIGSADQLTVGPGLARLMRDGEVTVATLTPSVWAALPVLPMPRLRIVAAAGERLPPAVVRKWSAPGRRVLNLYGPAETAVWATWHECDDGDGEPPIGRPVPNKRVYLLDRDGRPVSVGHSGELHIGGIGIGRYLGRPDLMDERFLPDPFSTEPGRLLYRTGDICRWRPDGVLEYVGRRDRQVKIRGQRVELEEVERAIEAVPGVRACAVTQRGQSLEAVVVAESGSFDEPAIRGHLVARLHSGMIPARFAFVDELPRTLVGKLDRQESTSPEDRPVLEAASGSPPAPVLKAASGPPPRPHTTTVGERHGHPPEEPPFAEESRLTWRIACVFASCLKLPQRRVRATSDFFSLGGDSLSVAELLTSVERETGSLLDIEQIIGAPTPQAISAHVLTGRAS